MASRHAVRNLRLLSRVSSFTLQLTKRQTQCSLLNPNNNRTQMKFVVPASFHTSSKLANEHIINIQDQEDFDKRVLQSSTPVIVDFHAGWCGPCKILGPRLESMVGAKNGKVLLAKIDIDDNSDLAVDHGVQAVPTVLAMKNGKTVDKFVGVKDDADLEGFIKKLIGE